MKNFFKLLGWSIAILVLVLAVIGVYNYQETTKRAEAQERAQLAFFAAPDEWQWQSNYNGIQISTKPRNNGFTALRKVVVSRSPSSVSHSVTAYFDEGGSVDFDIFWETPCEPNSKIDTGKKLKGKAAILDCNKAGTGLVLQLNYAHGIPTDRIELDMGGFKFNVDFSAWDFSPLEREFTLNSAKTTDN